MEFGATLDVLAKLGNFVAGLVAVIVAPLAFLQLRLIVEQLEAARVSQQLSIQVERERRTLEACRSFHTDPTLCDIKRKIYLARKGNEPAKALKALKRELSNYLNFLESLCIGIEQGIYDDQIVFDNLRVQIFSAVDYFMERHPKYNPEGDLVSKQNFQPLERVHGRFKDRELGIRAPTTYRSGPNEDGSGAGRQGRGKLHRIWDVIKEKPIRG